MTRAALPLLALLACGCAHAPVARYPVLNLDRVAIGDTLHAVDSATHLWRMVYVDSTSRLRFFGKGSRSLPARRVR